MLRKLRKALQVVRFSEGRRGLRMGVAATVEHMRFLQNHRFGTVLDAGANKGQFSLAVLCAEPTADIIAFEPLAAPAAIYQRLFTGRPSVMLHRVALGATPAQTEMHVSRRDDSSSLLPITEVQTEIFRGTEEIGTEIISVIPLDQILTGAVLRKPVLLKIDVQGFELELLKGGEHSLQHVDHIYCELSFLPMYEGQPLASEVIEWLRQRGFLLQGVYHIAHSREGLAVQVDCHFVRTATD